MDEPEPHDAHVRAARKVFRDCGFDLMAMQFPRCRDALIGLKRFNGLPDDAKVPLGWHYHPNAAMRDNWRRYYGDLLEVAR
jgi:hypothetical protein